MCMNDTSTKSGSVDRERPNAFNRVLVPATVNDSELEQLSCTSNELLIINRCFLDAILQALSERKTILYFDIQAIKNKGNNCVRSA